MRAYLIAADGTGAEALSEFDALVLGGWCLANAPSLRGEAEAIQGHRPGVASAALDGFAPLAMTSEGASRLLLRVDGIDDPGLAAAALPVDAVVLPATHGRDIAHLGARLAVHEAEQGLPDGGIGILALVACPMGVLQAASFAGASRRLRGIGWDAALADRLGADALTAEGRWSPVLAQARAMARLAAAAAGVEAVEAAYPGEDLSGIVAAARRDGFAAMFARDLAQARLIRAAT